MEEDSIPGRGYNKGESAEAGMDMECLEFWKEFN